MGIFDLFKRKEMNMQSISTNSNNDTQPVQEASIQNTEQFNISGDFVMEVEDVFSIAGRGTVVTGRVIQGKINLNESVTISETNMTTSVIGIEQFRKQLDYAQAGDNVGLLLSNVSRNDIARGMHLVK